VIRIGATMTACFTAQQFERSSNLASSEGAGEVTLDLVLETLDLIDLAILIVDRAGRVFYSNRAARAFLREGQVLRLSAGRLSSVGPKASSGLQGAVAALARNSADRPRHGALVPLTDIDGTVRAASWVLPLSAGRLVAKGPCSEGCAVVVVREIARAGAISSEFFARCYGVTQAERRLLQTLAEGMTVTEAGHALKVSPNTVKSHLKSLFAKTGTNRQAELMRLALTTTPPASTPMTARLDMGLGSHMAG
jgi:DNA-binding CsgD family transcriptional regulator